MSYDLSKNLGLARSMKIEPNPHGSLWIDLHSGDDDYPGCRLSIAAFNKYFTQRLPNWLVRPYKKQNDFRGSKYTTLHDRTYGVSLTDNYLSFHFGRQMDDSEEDKQKGFFLPWGEWEHVRHTLYNLDGSVHVASVGDKYKEWEEARKSVPKAEFNCKDFDGMEFATTAFIEEREWRRGVGWFKWLRWFVQPKISRSLDLRFSEPIGRRKDSWKGGTTGHGINMQPNESVKSAFQRYCDEHELTLCSSVS